jgi:hypothetical protein
LTKDFNRKDKRSSAVRADSLLLILLPRWEECQRS